MPYDLFSLKNPSWLVMPTVGSVRFGFGFKVAVFNQNRTKPQNQPILYEKNQLIGILYNFRFFLVPYISYVRNMEPTTTFLIFCMEFVYLYISKFDCGGGDKILRSVHMRFRTNALYGTKKNSIRNWKIIPNKYK